MITITLDPNDKRNANRKLDSLDDISDILRRPMDRALFRLQNRMADYPPQPPGSTYRRTGTLGRRWTTARREIPRAGRNEIQGRIGNNTEYGPYVQSKRWQARVHRNRWDTDEDIAKQEESSIKREFEKALDDKAK